MGTEEGHARQQTLEVRLALVAGAAWELQQASSSSHAMFNRPATGVQDGAGQKSHPQGLDQPEKQARTLLNFAWAYVFVKQGVPRTVR